MALSLKRQGKTSATVVSIGENEVLFSYETPVAAFVPGRGYLRTDRHFSVTTSRHINKFIGEDYPHACDCSTVVPHDEIVKLAG